MNRAIISRKSAASATVAWRAGGCVTVCRRITPVRARGGLRHRWSRDPAGGGGGRELRAAAAGRDSWREHALAERPRLELGRILRAADAKRCRSSRRLRPDDVRELVCEKLLAGRRPGGVPPRRECDVRPERPCVG